jgi:hypothetical protein
MGTAQQIEKEMKSSPEAINFNKAIEMMRREGARLVRIYTKARPGYAHFIVPGGYVDPDTAEKIKKHPLVIAGRDGLLPDHDQTWRMSAPRL